MNENEREKNRQRKRKTEKREKKKNHQTLLVSWFTISNAHVYVCDTSS